MADDIVDRLRERAYGCYCDDLQARCSPCRERHEAADEIERLRIAIRIGNENCADDFYLRTNPAWQEMVQYGIADDLQSADLELEEADRG